MTHGVIDCRVVGYTKQQQADERNLKPAHSATMTFSYLEYQGSFGPHNILGTNSGFAPEEDYSEISQAIGIS